MQPLHRYKSVGKISNKENLVYLQFTYTEMDNRCHYQDSKFTLTTFGFIIRTYHVDECVLFAYHKWVLVIQKTAKLKIWTKFSLHNGSSIE